MSSLDWVDGVRSAWDLVPVGAVAEVRSGYPFPSEHFSKSAGIPLIRIRDLEKSETEVGFTGDPVETAWVEPGDLLVGMDGEFNALPWKGERALLNQRMACVRARDVHQGFLIYVLPLPLKYIENIKFSTTVKHLSIGEIRSSKIPVPDLAEQRAIALFLDGETARIDALIEKKRRLLDLLEEKRRALIIRTVTQGLDADVPMKDSGVEWIGEIPEHWRVVPVNALADLVNGYPLDAAHFHPSEGTPVIRIRDLESDSTATQYNAVPPTELRVDTGDIIIGMDGDFNVSRWRGTQALLNQRMCSLHPKRHVNATLLYHSLPRPLEVINDLTHSTTVKHLSSSQVRSIKIPVPPRDEQDRIAGFLEKMEESRKRLVGTVETAIELLQEYRSALISAAVSGKIDVRDKAPA